MTKGRAFLFSHSCKRFLGGTQRKISLSAYSLGDGISYLNQRTRPQVKRGPVFLLKQKDKSVEIASLDDSPKESIDHLLFSRQYVVIVAEGLSSGSAEQLVVLAAISHICTYHGLALSFKDPEHKSVIKQYLVNGGPLEVNIVDDDGEGLVWEDWKFLGAGATIFQLRLSLQGDDIHCEKVIGTISHDHGYISLP